MAMTPQQLEQLARSVRNGEAGGFREVLVKVTERELAALTVPMEEHPDWWEHLCFCATCRSYA